jgi:hypothetical protein
MLFQSTDVFSASKTGKPRFVLQKVYAGFITSIKFIRGVVITCISAVFLLLCLPLVLFFMSRYGSWMFDLILDIYAWFFSLFEKRHVLVEGIDYVEDPFVLDQADRFISLHKPDLSGYEISDTEIEDEWPMLFKDDDPTYDPDATNIVYHEPDPVISDEDYAELAGIPKRTIPH